MATQENPAQTSQTKPDNKDVTEAKVKAKRKVTYIFKAISSTNLNIPYAVAVNGVVLDEYKEKPKRVSGSNGKIKVVVDSGSKVSLYLNSDSHPSYRKNAVYEVTPGERNVEVKISEKYGKHTTPDTPVLTLVKADDNYKSPLTGDIWMKVSHKFTADEVDALMPSGTCAEVVAAVKSIYGVLPTHTLSIVFPTTADTAALILNVTFNDSKNPKDNISNYDLLNDGLTRVHPAGYAALFNAAREAGISKLTMSSAWRPLLGSIAHRAGLGLDISYVGDTPVNRQELRVSGAIDTTNVSEQEKALLKEFEKAKVNQTKAQKDLDAAQLAYQNAKGEPEKAAAKQVMDDMKAKLKEAKSARESAGKAWNDERDKNEPADMKAFRSALLGYACVRQLFDPWFMDENVQDTVAATPNMQLSGNETLHAHHLHITVHDPKIL